MITGPFYTYRRIHIGGNTSCNYPSGPHAALAIWLCQYHKTTAGLLVCWNRIQR